MPPIRLNPKADEALDEEERAAVRAAHEKLTAVIEEAGEFVAAEALAETAESTVVRTVRSSSPS